MFLKNHWNILIVVLLLAGGAMAEQCMVELKDVSRGVHVTVESCGNIGTFSVGGLSDGRWERLTYHYPDAWKGTFLSVRIDDRIYSNFAESQDKIFMDQYLEKAPVVEGETILTSWRLPGDILLEERFELVDRGVMLTLEITNEGGICADTGIRLHLDTMLGENDGAPIYIPGDGLKSKEKEYEGKSLDFEYWKAYNRGENATIISSGILYGEGLTYPDRLLVANWKKSIYSSWDYTIDGNISILGDSAVILYYDTGRLDPGQGKTIATKYINGEPVIRGEFGIGEIVTAGNIEAVYCPGSTAVIKIDVISEKSGNEGQLSLEIEDEKGRIFYTQRENTGRMGEESLDIPFSWQIPRNITPTYFSVYATLYDMDGNEVGSEETQILVDAAACGVRGGAGLNWILLLIPLIVILVAGVLFFVVNMYSKLGDVEIVKEKEGERVKVTVWNKKKKGITNCIILDRIMEGAEVDTLTSGVKRKDTELIQYVGALESGGKAILEYRIKDVEFLPPAVVRWDFGESVSR